MPTRVVFRPAERPSVWNQIQLLRQPRAADKRKALASVMRSLDASPDDGPPLEWSEEDVVRLHCLLLEDLRGLADPQTSLEEKLDTLRWIYTDPDKDGKPFSFASCVRVAGCSPFSTFPYLGALHPDDIRTLLRPHVRRWIEQTLTRYPSDVAEAIRRDPEWVMQRLDRDPQWFSELLSQHTTARERCE